MAEIKQSKLLNPVFLGYFLLYFIYLVPKCRADCKILPPAKPNDLKRETELLNKLKPLYGMTYEVVDTVNKNISYKVSICDHVPGSSNPNASAIQHTPNGTFTLGRFNMVDIMGGTDWILLYYYGGDNYTHHCSSNSRVAKIMIICDPDNLKGKFEILEERKHSQDDCYYLFELSSNVSCTLKPPVNKSSKLSSGSVFCIIFFTVISVYLICGVLYKRIVIGAKGLEQIPNYTFWRDFGNLQADGCDYLCRWGSRQESQAYRGIDDRIKVDEERDDQLLNM